MNDFYETFYIFAWIDFIGPAITFPIFAAVALALNLLVILTIRSKKNKKEKLFESKMFQIIQLNSAFICVECVSYQFRLMGLCLGLNSNFCSGVRDSSFVWYFLIANFYLSEAMKSCSMITGLLFSIQRYVDSSKNENRLLKWITDFTILKSSIIAIAYGCAVSPAVFFNVDFSAIRFHQFSNGQYSCCFSTSFRLLFSHEVPQTIFYFMYYFLNDVVILILNLAIDILLVRIIKAQLEEKLQAKYSKETKELSKLEKKKMEEEIKKKTSVERKSNAMIILNVVIYLFCRLPELFGVFVLYFFDTIHR